MNKLVKVGLVLVLGLSQLSLNAKEKLDVYVGSYLPSLLSTRSLNITLENQRLFVESKGQGKFEMEHLKDRVFGLKGVPFKLRFSELESGQLNQVYLVTPKGERPFTRKQWLVSEYKKVATQVRPNGLADAILLNDVTSAKVLIKKGSDLHELDTREHIAGPNGRRPLNWAAVENKPKLIQLLISAGADINKTNLSGFTPLHHAAETQSMDSAKILLELGADTRLKTNNGHTAYELAALNDNRKLMALIQQYEKQ